MASSSSYIIGKKLTTNSACFSNFTTNTPHQEVRQFIVVEPGKSYFSKEITKKWLEELKKMGFNFTYRYRGDKLMIDTSRLCIKGNKWHKVTFCMLVRFLWEGTYNRNSYSGEYDHFYKVIPHYFNLLKYNKTFNEVSLICIACNLYLIPRPNFNSNHFLCYTSGCVIKKELPFIHNGVNGYFTDIHGISCKLDILRERVKSKKIEDPIKLAKYALNFYTHG